MTFDLLFGESGEDGCGPDTLAEDLRLDLLLSAMSDGDGRTAEACRQVLLRPLTDAAAISARCEVRRDVSAHSRLFEAWLSAAREALDGAARYAEAQNPRYDRIIPNQKKLITEAEIARLNLKALRRIHASVADAPKAFCSEAVGQWIAAVRLRYAEANLSRIEARLDQLDSLRQSDDLTLSAAIGKGLKPVSVVLNGLAGPAQGRRPRRKEKETAIPLSSIALIQNAEEIVQSAVLPLYQAVAGFNANLRRFFEKLSFQLSFYLGCVRLRTRLEALGVPLCEPAFRPETDLFESRNLQNAGLALLEKAVPTGNDVCFSGKRLVLVTGVNQGGKTTFLRSVGQAQLMAQCGLFVAAESYVCPVFSGIYTHFPSGEDATRQMGLLDVELQKLSRIVDRIRPRGLLMMNESFQTTMPQDAKYLADLTVRAFVDAGVTVLFVTHLYAYASQQYEEHRADVLCLRARRPVGGKGAFVMKEGEPYTSASGTELFREMLGEP